MPTTLPKPNCEASKTTLPLPDPRSTKVYSERSIGSSRTITLKASGSVGS